MIDTRRPSLGNPSFDWRVWTALQALDLSSSSRVAVLKVLPASDLDSNPPGFVVLPFNLCELIAFITKTESAESKPEPLPQPSEPSPEVLKKKIRECAYLLVHDIKNGELFSPNATGNNTRAEISEIFNALGKYMKKIGEDKSVALANESGEAVLMATTPRTTFDALEERWDNICRNLFR